MNAKAEKIFYEMFTGLPRVGPGDDSSTQKAFSLLSDLPPQPAILDVGCGTGLQTLALAKVCDGQITAVDNYQLFLDQLNNDAQKQGLANKIKTVNASMEEMPFTENAFDLIWSEGAIYLMGFQNGMQQWRKFLKPGGYLVVSEASWLQENPPQEVRGFWEREYPAIQLDEDNKKDIEAAGYTLINSFVLPESSWWDQFYLPQEKKLAEMRIKYKDDPEALEVIASGEFEIELFRKYSDYYGYIFYVMQKK